jgi:hypothetical protein
MDAMIRRVLEDTAYEKNPYFIALADGSFEHADFVETQVQFHYAVDFFSRPMAAVAAKIPHAYRRMEVLRNVWEEHGEGDAKMAHGTTFLIFLERLAMIDAAGVAKRALWPEVRIFNTTLVGAAVLDDYLVSVAMMGIIERMFADISSWIGRAVVTRGWIERERMIHYTLHEKIDFKHADDFFDVLRPAWAQSATDRYQIEQGMRLGAAVFDGMYRGLYEHRTRRAFMEP